MDDPPCFKLKFDRWRGATWYDREEHVVFLLAAGRREDGDPEDFYKEVGRLRDQNRLYPGDPDYHELTVWRTGRWLREIRYNAGPTLRREACAEPDVPRELDLGQCVAIVVAYAVDEHFIFEIRLDQPAGGGYFSPHQALLVAQAIAEGTGQEVEPNYRWNGQQLPHGSYGFDFMY